LHIEPRWRSYDPATQERLRDLFGPPQRWGDTLRSLLWARVNLTVPAFRGEVTLPLPVPCSYDLEVAASKYFHALPDGYVQLTALFSGSIFSGGQVQPVPWDKEAHYRLPVRLWQEAMDRHFPNSAWLRVQRDVFDRLCLYRSRRALPSWEQVFEELLAPTSDEVPA
ncbi:MAG: DUF6084 family protein, partial [Chloroflexota bacterium]